jgi:hypothetical protein
MRGARVSARRRTNSTPHERERVQRSSQAAYAAERARSSVVEQLAFNQLVVGSIPTGLTKRLSVVSSWLSVATERVRLRQRLRCEAREARTTRRTTSTPQSAERAQRSRRAREEHATRRVRLRKRGECEAHERARGGVRLVRRTKRERVQRSSRPGSAAERPHRLEA